MALTTQLQGIGECKRLSVSEPQTIAVFGVVTALTIKSPVGEDHIFVKALKLMSLSGRYVSSQSHLVAG